MLTTSNGEEGEDADDSLLITINEAKENMLMILCFPQAMEKKEKMPMTLCLPQAMEKKEKMPMTMCSVVMSIPAASIPE